MPNSSWHWRNLLWLWVTVAVIILDQLSKWFMSHWLELYQSHQVFSLFSFTLLHNTGAAFSFLDGQGTWASFLLGAIAISVSVIILIWMLRTAQHRRWLLVALALILGGALGNLWDRLSLGYVVDFLLFHYKNWYFPAFNLADSSITIGAIMLIIDMVFFSDDKTNSSKQ